MPPRSPPPIGVFVDVVVIALKLEAFTEALFVMLYEATFESAAIFLTSEIVAVGIVIDVVVSEDDESLEEDSDDCAAFICSNIFSRLADNVTVDPTELAAFVAAFRAAFCTINPAITNAKITVDVRTNKTERPFRAHNVIPARFTKFMLLVAPIIVSLRYLLQHHRLNLTVIGYHNRPSDHHYHQSPQFAGSYLVDLFHLNQTDETLQ